MIKEEKLAQYGEYGNDGSGILITETTNPDAQEYFDYLNNECTDKNAVHFICDSKQIIDVMPVEYMVYCTGKGKDWAYKHCLIVGICQNNNNDIFRSSLDKAINLIKELQDSFVLTNNDIYFVNEFNLTRYDPKTLLETYGTKKHFIEEEFNR